MFSSKTYLHIKLQLNLIGLQFLDSTLEKSLYLEHQVRFGHINTTTADVENIIIQYRKKLPKQSISFLNKYRLLVITPNIGWNAELQTMWIDICRVLNPKSIEFTPDYIYSGSLQSLNFVPTTLYLLLHFHNNFFCDILFVKNLEVIEKTQLDNIEIDSAGNISKNNAYLIGEQIQQMKMHNKVDTVHTISSIINPKSRLYLSKVLGKVVV